MVEEVKRAEFQDIVEALGTTRANESVTITAKQTENVASIHFDEGQTVEAGQLLVQLDNGTEQAELALARSELREAQREYNRIRQLVREQKVAELELDRLSSQMEQAQARIDRAEVNLTEHEIRAPFAGVIGLREISPGTLLTPGSMITTLDDISVIKLDFTLPERFLSALNVGDTIVARTQALPGRSFQGRVDLLSPRVDPASRALTARALIPNPGGFLRPGMLMKIDLLYGSRDSLLVPEEAVFSLGDDHFVYVLSEQSQVQQRQVILGSRRAGIVEITAGLEAGELVITRGRFKVRDGQTVNVQEETWRQPSPAKTNSTGTDSNG